MNQYQMFADQICEYTLLQNGCNLKVVFFSLKFAPLASFRVKYPFKFLA